MTVYKITDNELERYMKLIIRRDNLQAEASQWEMKYIIEFGESMCKLFELKVECIRLRKQIHFCQLKRNHGLDIDPEEMRICIERAMAGYEDQLEELREQYNYAQESEPLTHVEVQEIKSIYRRIAKRIHPDVHPETMEDEILRDLWGMTAVSYRARDLEALQTLEIRVRKRIVELGGIDEEDVEIDDLEEKIEQVESEIEKIITTDPYQYSVFLIRDDLVTQRHEDLEEEILQYQKHSIDLQTILENLLSGGDVTVE